MINCFTDSVSGGTDFFRCSVLFDMPVFHNYDVGSECQCFPDIVCDFG